MVKMLGVFTIVMNGIHDICGCIIYWVIEVLMAEKRVMSLMHGILFM
jgi:hypothetical protein